MNVVSFDGYFKRLRLKLALQMRLTDTRTRTNSFMSAGSEDSIERIYVINLDRKPDRWLQISRELRRFRSNSGSSLFSITRRFSAIDARYLATDPDERILQPTYSLAEQLLVEPNQRLQIDASSQVRRIKMTRQEIAVALSHIEVWRLIATRDIEYTLVLEDDVYFQRGFARSLDASWLSFTNQSKKRTAFDLLYLSCKEVGISTQDVKRSRELVRSPDRGIWYASGYVLSRSGAQKLLNLLPTHGPIDLWLNLQFEKLDVFTVSRSIIEQRIDTVSTNSYSVLPVLSQVGVVTREKPLLPQATKLPGPIFAVGESGTGLTALATALSMLGYTCCSDLSELPSSELDSLLDKKHDCRFNAYVNIGSFDSELLRKIEGLYADARFILTGSRNTWLPMITPSKKLFLPNEHRDKWAALSAFLEVEYPALPYPNSKDIVQQDIISHPKEGYALPFKRLKFDSSPWIMSQKGWHGIAIADIGQNENMKPATTQTWSSDATFNDTEWMLRDDTFPSNLSLFVPENFASISTAFSNLTLRKETTSVRNFTSAAIASRKSFKYGTFAAEIRPSNVSGLITGIFLHRNGPRQEIDIEFLGKDTTKMLVNVYFNPGTEGTKLEYGYRGTPTLIELGFDASKDFHGYEIEWNANVIRWRVDGRVVHERRIWDPTPIPNLSMEFNVNLWHSRSTKLAGKLNINELPAHTEIKSIRINQYRETITSPLKSSAA